MRHSQITPIAVSLSLIVAMALQPIAVCWASRDCSSGCSDVATTTTESCGCCCGHREDIESTQATSSCCSVAQAVADRNDSNARKIEDESTVVEFVSPTVRKVCLCQQDSQPLGDSSSGRTTGKFRVSVSILSNGSGALCSMNSAKLLAAVATDRLQPPSVQPQVDFSVWRL